MRRWVSLAMMEEEVGGELGLGLDLGLNSEGMMRFYLKRLVQSCAKY